MVGRGEDIRYPQYRADVLEELRCELRPIVRQKRFWRTIMEDPVHREGDCHGIRVHPAQGDDLREFREAIRNHKEEAIPLLRFR